jgi:glycine/D-amino acid oxidase-like deaminating enzyme
MGRVVIVGGGIAGLSTASALARRRVAVTMFECAPALAGMSSALNAGIFRLALSEEVNVALALRSLAIAAQVAPGALHTTGGYYASADESERRQILATSATADVRTATEEERPAWLGHRDRPALWSPHDATIDLPALTTAIASDARHCGAELRCGSAVEALDITAGSVTGVVVDGTVEKGDLVVDCTGAWSTRLPGAPLRVVSPMRRHLFILEPGPAVVTHLVWDMTDGVYVRSHPEGVLASACDESPCAPSNPVPVDAAVTQQLRRKLASFAPALADRKILREWAGLRPLTPDHRFIIGPDPHLPGLFRVAGLGGHGMTGGLAAGEWAARQICGELVPEARELDPRRFS